MATTGFTSRVVYDGSGTQTFSTDSDGVNQLTTTTTDDGFYNLGDEREAGSSYEFAGTFDSGGHTFVVFHRTGATGESVIYSFTADVVDYPATYTQGSVSLDTSAFPVCFAKGTLIATPEGDVPVESLAIGDMVRSAEGHCAVVKWIGRQTVSTRFGPADRLMPVRFAAGSLGGGLPQTDLTVTADHGMLVGGVICHAGALVNGETITRVPLSEMGESYTVYHVETEAHEIILANGAPTETFIDNVSRWVFDNFAEFDALFGDVPEMVELPYPRAMSARQVPGPILQMLAMIRSA